MEKERKPSYFSRLKRRRQSKRNHTEPPVAKQNQSQLAITEQNQQEHLKVDISRGTMTKDEKLLSSGTDSKMSLVSREPIAGGNKTCLEDKQGSIDNSQSTSGGKKEKWKPPGTVAYTAGPEDTLNSIALKFNITPNKLVQLNRLFSRSVLPGQVLFVPDTGHSDSCPSASTTHSSHESERPSDTLSTQKEAKPLRRVLSPGSEDEEPAKVKFLKMSCRYFTDGMGVVGGVMIVTPNNIMFDPHKSDPLVIENGCEEYGLICPMEEVVSIALYSDISHMKLKDALPSDLPQDLCPLYRPGEWEDLPSEHDLNPFSRFEALGRDKRPIVLDDIEAMITDAPESEGTEKSPSDEGFTELELPSVGNTDESQGDAEGLDDLGPQKQSTPEGLSPSEGGPNVPVELERQHEEEEEVDNGEDKHGSINNCTDGLQEQVRLKVPARSGTSEEVLAASTASKASNWNFTKTLAEDQKCNAEFSEKRSSANGDDSVLNGLKSNAVSCEEMAPSQLSDEDVQKRNQEMEMKAWLLKRMQGPIEDMLLSKEEKSKNPPMFLCFKVGKPMRKSFATGQMSSPAHSYGMQGHVPEYWFAVPQERVDHLYEFFVQWSPDVYGKDAREQGFIVVEKDELDMVDNFFSSPAPKSWEIITVNEARRRRSVGSFEDDELVDMLPVLSDPSLLFEDLHLQKLANYLPVRIQGYPWRLAYSTAVHGTSLKTLYRSMADLDSPVLLVIKDMDNQIFGAFSTHPFRISEHCYGTGETFLYSFCPEIRVFRWSGENSYFVKGSMDSLQMGGGRGHFGLWLDADLYHGSSSPCTTFKNQPLSAQQDFIVQDLEVWTFQ